MQSDNPLLQMPDADRAEWIYLIHNDGNGERMALNQVEGLGQRHIDEVMAEAEYERCSFCGGWAESYYCRQSNCGSVCEDCIEDGEPLE